MSDPNETPDPAEAAPEPLEQTTPPVDESFAVDLSPSEGE